MKILIPFTGVIGIAGIVLGSLFKILHLPGANELILIGIIIQIAIFLPLVLIHRYRKSAG